MTDHRKTMLKALAKSLERQHLKALENGDEATAQRLLEKLNKLYGK